MISSSTSILSFFIFFLRGHRRVLYYRRPYYAVADGSCTTGVHIYAVADGSCTTGVTLYAVADGSCTTGVHFTRSPTGLVLPAPILRGSLLACTPAPIAREPTGLASGAHSGPTGLVLRAILLCLLERSWTRCGLLLCSQSLATLL